MEQFTKYQLLHKNGLSAEDVYRVAQKDGVNQIAIIQMLIEVFQLSLVEAKSIIIAANTGLSLAEYQGTLLPVIEKALNDLQHDLNHDNQ